MKKIVVRIIDINEKTLLGWAEVEAHVPGDGKLWFKDPTMIIMETEGTAAFVSLHWCDVNVEIRSAMELQKVKPGEVITIPGDLPVITVGPMATGLPAVTVRNNISIGIPVGNLGVKAN